MHGPVNPKELPGSGCPPLSVILSEAKDLARERLEPCLGKIRGMTLPEAEKHLSLALGKGALGGPHHVPGAALDGGDR